MRWTGWLALATVPAMLAGDVGLATSWFELVKINPTHSIEPGIYVRTFEEPVVGSTVWFPLPPVAAGWMDSQHLEPALRVFDNRVNGLLKPIVGTRGDVICRKRGVFSVNGRALARIPANKPLPVWSGCVKLDEDHVAVFSDGEKDGFDSRMYGPVRKAAVKTYTLFWRFGK